MKPEDWVRILTLFSSGFLFYGSYRGQQWVKRQAALEDRVAKQALQPAANRDAGTTSTSDSAPGSAKALDEARRRISSAPYFDRIAYILFCVGFAISGVASLIDLCNHGTFARIVGH
jgi:hypothetical protein